MSLTDVIAVFATPGPLTVTRQTAGGYTDGIYAPDTTSTLPIIACVQPLGGRTLRSLAEGEAAVETRELDTVTELFTRTATREPDLVAIDGEAWQVAKVARWQSFGTVHYHVTVSRRVLP